MVIVMRNGEARLYTAAVTVLYNWQVVVQSRQGRRGDRVIRGGTSHLRLMTPVYAVTHPPSPSLHLLHLALNNTPYRTRRRLNDLGPLNARHIGDRLRIDGLVEPVTASVEGLDVGLAFGLVV